MAGSVNRVTLIGNLTKDVETRSFSNGGKVCNMTVATSERWTDKSSGEKRESSQFHNVAIFNENLIKVAENYLSKGKKVYLEGQLQTRKWQDRDGNDRWTTEVVLQKFRGELVLLDSRNAGQSNDSNGSQGQSQSQGNQSFEMDDSIPFS